VKDNCLFPTAICQRQRAAPLLYRVPGIFTAVDAMVTLVFPIQISDPICPVVRGRAKAPGDLLGTLSYAEQAGNVLTAN